MKGKGKFHHITGHEGPEGEWRYSFTVSLTSAHYVDVWIVSGIVQAMYGSDIIWTAGTV